MGAGKGANVQNMKPRAFFLLAIGATWLAWLWPVAFGWTIWESPAVWFLYAGGACVPVAALLLAWKEGRLPSLLERLFDPRLIPARWWLVTLLLMPMTNLISGTLVAMLGGENNALLASSAVQMSFAQLLGFAAFILLLGPLPEEIGWRGYALPALLNRHTALSATLVLGAMWGLWHVPLFFMPGYYEAFGGAPDPALFFGNILIISFFYTWLFLHTKGSILAAVLFHFSVNFSGELIALPDQGEWIKTAILACAVIAIVAYRPDAWTSKPAG